MDVAARNRFGKLLRDFRKREGLSQIKLASWLNVDDSTVNKLEAGSRRPPRDPKFYERLREVPGFTTSDITLLLQAAEYAPAWLSEFNKGQGVRSRTPQQQSVGESGVTFNFTVEAATTNLTDEDVEELKALAEKELKSFLHHFLLRKYERYKILKEQKLD
jgi:transcriptional regulator with XRE-family HTH domain